MTPVSDHVRSLRERTVAVIPCRNESRAIGALVRAMAGHVARVIVVDDGSMDGTGRVALEAGAWVVRHDRSEGKGAAMATGWTRAAESGAEWVLLLDGDGQHAPAEAPGLLAAARDGVRLVVGNRMAESSKMPWVRRWTNRWMSRRISQMAGLPIPDSQCGYRLAHLPTLLSLALKTRHFEIESEMLVAFARAGHGIAFTPVSVRYGEEQSKISVWRDALRWVRWRRDVRRRGGSGIRAEGGEG